jgi:hypothetical protein
MENEIWLTAIGFGGRYSVSSFGRVRRNPYETVIKGNVTRLGEKIYKASPSQSTGGYRIINLRRDGEKSRPHLVHRLVAEAFIGPCPNGMECAHNDGDPKNSNITNLRWATPKDNNLDKIKHGTLRVGESIPLAKLTDDLVLAIRADKRSQSAIARELNVTPSLINKVVRRKIWRHI